MKRDKIFLCEGMLKDETLCPKRENCAFFCIGFDKTKTDHFAWAPYNTKKQDCDEFEQIDLDFNQLNITSNA